VITLTKVNDAYLRVDGEPSQLMELRDSYKFFVPGHKFMPAFRRGSWDGTISLYNQRTRQIYAGLHDSIVEFCQSREYDYQSVNFDQPTEYSEQDLDQLIETLNLPYEVRPYQKQYVLESIVNKRRTLISPTASGKSLIIYLIFRAINAKTLIVVPDTGLIHQMASDVATYGYKPHVHKIFAGQIKDTDDQLTVTTWQSIHQQPEKWFDQFGVIFVDECHQAKADKLQLIMSKATKTKYRYGLTGTLDGIPVHKLVIEGLFGPAIQFTSTAELIENKHLSEFDIRCVVLNYSDDTKKQLRGLNYQQEVDWIIANKKRNLFITKLVNSLDGNTLVLFRFIEKHGDSLIKLVKENTNRPVFYVHGKVKGEIRNQIREIVNQHDDAIIVASYQTFSTGINIPTLKNIVFASPWKARVKILQSIGRVLRKSHSKTKARLIDISDNLSAGKKKNYTLLHFLERVKIYNSEKFPYTVFNHNLE
jgi:superfamily II DNA or RNA helicase